MIFYAIVCANLWVRFLFLSFIFVCTFRLPHRHRFHRVHGNVYIHIRIVNMWEHFFLFFFFKYCAGLFSFSVYMLVDSDRTRTPNLSLNLKLNRSLGAEAEAEAGELGLRLRLELTLRLTLVLLCRTHFVFDLCSEPFLNNK